MSRYDGTFLPEIEKYWRLEENKRQAIAREHARNGKKALIKTAVLAVVIIGGLVWKAIEGYITMAAEWKAAKASIPMPLAESDFNALLVIMALSAVLAVVCWAMMWESNDRYWGVK